MPFSKPPLQSWRSNLVPSLSICIGIPTFRRAHRLATLLDTLNRLLVARPHVRVCVVNDGSHDASYEQTLAGGQFTWLDYRVLKENHGCGGARRAAFEAAQEEILVCIDDDSVPTEAWLTQVEMLSTANPVIDFFAGDVVPVWNTPPSSYVEDLSCIDLKPSSVMTTHGLITAVAANLVMRRLAYERAGGFFEDMPGAEDCDITQRMIASGAVYKVAPDLIIGHLAQKRYGPMRARFRSYGFYAARYVLIRQDWRIASSQPNSGVRDFWWRAQRQFSRIYIGAKREGFSFFRCMRRAFFATLFSMTYDHAWQRALKREGRKLGASRPQPPVWADTFVDFT